MDEPGLRRKDTTKGPPLRILSLDGGGVRGYSTMIILQELMHRTFVEIEGRAPKRHEIPKPCDHFDLIAGTGTGGLIAIMLGRLRLDLDTCKELYVRMTRRVFETDKTFAGIPLKSTMFKASKLEEAIMECVREHTVSDAEGNDALANATPMGSEARQSVDSPVSPDALPQRTLSQSSNSGRTSRFSTNTAYNRTNFGSLSQGNPNALLYDTRENRTKTAVTAVMKGTPVTKLLRSYDSRREPAPETNCSIWQAGRATSATAMAFKPIQIGQTVYLDEGSGKYNPAPLILDEAVQSEWPGRDVGVFVSIGTGKRPNNTGRSKDEWWEGFLGGSMSDFAEARRRLVARLEACEDTHRFMQERHCAARGVDVENYYRLNVEVGVGEFAMNEWARLGEISTNTRMYLAKERVGEMNQSAAVKMAKIHLAKMRFERAVSRGSDSGGGWQHRYSYEDAYDKPLATQPTFAGGAVELPGDDYYYQTLPFRPGAQHYEHRPSIADQKYVVSPDDYTHPPPNTTSFSFTTTTPPQHHAQPYSANSSPYSPSDHQIQQSQPYQQSYPSSPPPIPPKTPIDDIGYADREWQDGYGPRTFMNMGDLGKRLPYPDVEGPPPAVNLGSKPQISR